jgi:hypothetical protein
LLTDRDKISNIYRAPSIYVSYKVSVHLAKQFQRRRSLEINQPQTSIAYGGHVYLGQAVSEEKNFKNRPIRNKN